MIITASPQYGSARLEGTCLVKGGQISKMGLWGLAVVAFLQQIAAAAAAARVIEPGNDNFGKWIKSATEAVDSELFAPGNLKAGRSLPNVHHFSSNVSGSNFTRNWVNANHGIPVAEYGSDRFVLHPSRGRSPGSHCHYSPYQRSLSPQTAHFESKFERHGPQTFSAQHYLQPPADSSWRRQDLIYCSTHSDPVLHASVVIGAYNNSMSAGFSQINHQPFTPTHSPPLNDSSSCGSPMCEACASSYYMCSQHEKVMSPVRSNDNTIQQTQATDVDSSSVYPDISTSPPSISSHSAPSPGDNMNAGIDVFFLNEINVKI
ncbi:hypothetical protein T06_7550 [Trichinella sp. T6]|nr:hypothetical protein T06_7550 [Trichinella sp. T6]